MNDNGIFPKDFWKSKHERIGLTPEKKVDAEIIGVALRSARNIDRQFDNPEYTVHETQRGTTKTETIDPVILEAKQDVDAFVRSVEARNSATKKLPIIPTLNLTKAAISHPDNGATAGFETERDKQDEEVVALHNTANPIAATFKPINRELFPETSKSSVGSDETEHHIPEIAITSANNRNTPFSVQSAETENTILEWSGNKSINSETLRKLGFSGQSDSTGVISPDDPIRQDAKEAETKIAEVDIVIIPEDPAIPVQTNTTPAKPIPSTIITPTTQELPRIPDEIQTPKPNRVKQSSTSESSGTKKSCFSAIRNAISEYFSRIEEPIEERETNKEVTASANVVYNQAFATPRVLRTGNKAPQQTGWEGNLYQSTPPVNPRIYAPSPARIPPTIAWR